METLYRTIRTLIAEKNYSELRSTSIPHPEKFNWVKEVFERIHVSDTPEATALLWTDGNTTHNYSFADVNGQCNRLLNFFRAKGVQQGDVIMTQLALQPVTWFSILATIKGGFRMVPAASILGPQDIAYRFGK